MDELRFICGEIGSVQAMTSRAVREFDVEDTAVVLLRFDNGALGTFTLSDTVAAPWSWEISSGENPMYPQQQVDCYLFAGTEGSLAVPSLELWHYPGEKSWGAKLVRERVNVVRGDPLVRQLRHFRRVIRGEERPRVSGTDATRTLAAAQAIHRSAETGRAVMVDQVE